MSGIKFFFLIFLTTNLYAGSAGVKNGTISGLVRDYKRHPLAGVTVVAVKQAEPPIIRSTASDENGQYVLNNMPVGSYTLGFDKYGYEPITTEEGDPKQQTAIGKQIRVYVESGAHVKAPNVSLQYIGIAGDAFVKINLIDAISGEKIDGGTVSIGSATVNFGSAGSYFLSVPVNTFSDPENNGQAIKIHAPGYQECQDTISLQPFQTAEQTIRLQPAMATVQGHIDLSRYPVKNFGSQGRIMVDGLPTEALNAQIDDSGFFSIQVPASNTNNKRFFNIKVLLPGFLPATISQVYAPEAGATTITAPIVMLAQTVPVSGKVLASTADGVINSAVNQAFIKELGVGTPIISGTYVFDNIPTAIELEITVIMMGAEGIETGGKKFTAIDNGTGVFCLPTIITTK